MKVATVADLHGNLISIPDCELLIIAGDICPFGDWTTQLAFLNGKFREWLKAIRARNIAVVAIAGNHDTIFEDHPNLVPWLPWVYLQDESTDVEKDVFEKRHFLKDQFPRGVKIWGTPWVLEYGHWAFMRDEQFLLERFAGIPVDTEILITHGPPFGYGDKVPRLPSEQQNQGSRSLLKAIEEVSPKLVVCGHIHEGQGVYQIGETTVVNAAIVDRNLEVAAKPTVVDVEVQCEFDYN